MINNNPNVNPTGSGQSIDTNDRIVLDIELTVVDYPLILAHTNLMSLTGLEANTVVLSEHAFCFQLDPIQRSETNPIPRL